MEQVIKLTDAEKEWFASLDAQSRAENLEQLEENEVIRRHQV